MKDFRNSNLRITLLSIVLLCSSVLVLSQTKTTPEVNKFLILIETTDNGFKLTGIEGCAFKEISFSYTSHKNQAVSQYGMVKSLKNNQSKENDAIDFLFKIDKTSDGVTLEGITGTAWKNLSFSCQNGSCHQYINQNGIADPEKK
jgi:hypothetical protein